MTRWLRCGLLSALILSASLWGSGSAQEPASAASVDTLGHARPQTVVFSGGCFWGVQAVFEHVQGVLRATAGYAGGTARTAEYEIVSTGTTGHAESVRVVYDPRQVSFGRLLEVFFSVVHDPTQLDHQGPDRGPQYRSAIWYATPEQAAAARTYIRHLTDAKTFSRPIVTAVNPLEGFYAAEAYHQDYYFMHPHQPYIVMNDTPKVRQLRRAFPALWREDPVRWMPRAAVSAGHP